MFTDLVGYSALAHRNEQLAIELLELHRVWIREVLPKHGGVEIETIGDAFLVEFSGALAAVECAVAIQQRFAEHNQAAPDDRRLRLRIGIHLGDIEHKGGKVMGDGVNIASRIHGMAKPGGICVSEQVHQSVKGRGLPFKDLGAPALKNIDTRLRLYTLGAAPSSGAADVGSMLRRSRSPLTALAVAGVLAAVAIVAWRAGTSNKSPAKEKSVAVLPFDNLSTDPDTAFFADGLHDTVIGHLARIHGLKVISRTSVMRFREKRESLKAIADELGVANIMEGSVQRAGNKLRVVAQLIDAESDTHLWSSEYDREVSDVFAVQADIARQVAGAVQVKLTPQEQASIKAIPTQNQQAYELYLRAIPYSRSIQQANATTLNKAIAFLDEALALDPNFALAYALRSGFHDTMHWFGFERTPARREQGRRDAERALSLAPDLAEAHVAMAGQLYHGDLNYAAAVRELEIALRLAPGNADSVFTLGAIYRRLDRWDDAVASFGQSAILDPLNAAILYDYAGTLVAVRRPAQAQAIFDRIVAIDDNPATRFDQAYTRFLHSGDAASLARVLGALPRESESDCAAMVQYARLLDASARHDEAIAVLEACPHPSFVSLVYNERVPTAHYVALSKWRKDPSRVPKEAAVARATFERELAVNRDRSQLRMLLAMNLVMSGERDRALAEVERALKEMPRSRDAFTANLLLAQAAEVHANTGQIDRAFAELEESLARPAGIYAVEIGISPEFAPLRPDPRYQALLAGKPLKAGR